MNVSIRNSAEAIVLSSISAFLFVVFFRINQAVFGALEHTEGVNWIFLPAGFRILLVLGMGVPGCVGIFLGNIFLDLEHLHHGHAILTVLTAIISGFTPWLVMEAMKHLRLLNEGLQHLTHQQLLHYTLAYAAANAFLHQLLWLVFTEHEHEIWTEIWPMFIGDLLGALIMLYAFKGLLVTLKLRSRDRSL